MVEADTTKLVDENFGKITKKISERITKLNDEFSNVSERKIEKNKVSKFDDYNNMDDNIEETLNVKYHKLLSNIVNKSFDILRVNSIESKRNRKIFRNFFLWFLSIQFLLITALVTLNGFDIISIGEKIITTMIASFFVETLGVVTIMVTFVFNSKTELGIINAIQKVAEHYKK